MAEEAKDPYPFRAPSSLVAEGKFLAKNYKISFNMLMVLLLEEAVKEWSVPGHESRPRPDDVEIKQQAEKDLT